MSHIFNTEPNAWCRNRVLMQQVIQLKQVRQCLATVELTFNGGLSNTIALNKIVLFICLCRHLG